MAAKEPARAISRAMVMGGSCGAGDLRLAPIHRYHHCIVPTTGRFNGPTRRRWIGVVEGGRGHNARAAAEKRALFYCLSDGLSDLALGE